jgi:hypothetical protein
MKPTVASLLAWAADDIGIPDVEAWITDAVSELESLSAEADRLRGALERIAKYPMVRGEELGYDGCRQVARAALEDPNQRVWQGDHWRKNNDN